MNRLYGLIFTGLLLTNFLTSAQVHAADACVLALDNARDYALDNVIDNHGLQSPTIQKWLQWEQTPSIPQYRLRVQSSLISSKQVDAALVDIEFAPDAPPALRELLVSVDGQTVNWFEHPYNRQPSVPFFNQSKPPGPNVQAEHNASRSVTIEVGGGIYGPKLPTDRPFGPDGDFQRSKADMREDVLLARKRSLIVEQVDQRLGPDDVLTMLRYIAVVKDKATGNGFVLRDLRPLQDGNYYLPAHQIPSVGREIAKANGAMTEEEFYDFWKQHWAIPLGIAQARCLIRYAFESEMTNPQNYLIQLDKNFKPTGKIFYRDITDSNLNAPLARAIGLGAFVDFDLDHRIKVHHVIVGWEHSLSIAWNFQTNSSGFDMKNVNNWRAAHLRAYDEEIIRMLNLTWRKYWDYQSLSQFLRSEAGARAVQQFHDNHQPAIPKAG